MFFAYLKLRDHSKIVDLVFLILTKKFSAPETSKTPHSWQNNVPILTLFAESFLRNNYFLINHSLETNYPLIIIPNQIIILW